eukprot:UN01032
MAPPRALWVPFEMGRPLATPQDAGLQRRILSAALSLLDEPEGEPLLCDFNEEASNPDGDSNWRFSETLDTKSPVAEATSLLPIWHKAQSQIKNRSLESAT